MYFMVHLNFGVIKYISIGGKICSFSGSIWWPKIGKSISLFKFKDSAVFVPTKERERERASEIRQGSGMKTEILDSIHLNWRIVKSLKYTYIVFNHKEGLLKWNMVARPQ